MRLSSAGVAFFVYLRVGLNLPGGRHFLTQRRLYHRRSHLTHPQKPTLKRASYGQPHKAMFDFQRS